MNIYEVLYRVRKEIPTFVKNASNPHFGSKFVDLPTIFETLIPILDKHGIVMMQAPLKTENGAMHLHTRLVYVGTSGSLQSPAEPDKPVEPNMVEFVTGLPVDKSTPQAAGSAITYMRRYAVVAFFGLIADNDDDGNAASLPEKKAGKDQIAVIEDLSRAKSYDLKGLLEKRGWKKTADMDAETAAKLIEHLNNL